MKKYFDLKTKNYMYEIFSGEDYATNEKDAVITTLVGSCVAVCLRDEYSGTVGMNHFMLPGRLRHNEKDLRYGACAMESLIEKMLELGAMKHRLTAKVFGGGNVVENASISVPASNVDFILEYLQEFIIPIAGSDLGRNYGRKIYLYQKNGKVLMKKIRSFDMAPISISGVAEFNG